ncbi:hypothetical protein BDW02DRAFT_649661 [Decorospora gaudefroyi]|uniref:Uncharacterized protein n=1 Tax=Decorospora gaudefroyi TaxID=184978 RepID=A0A6A5K4W2_9PLEO|nr:hypothetical protein BDW02DRAFT_649661 [Decorospora gaudefroyi]
MAKAATSASIPDLSGSSSAVNIHNALSPALEAVGSRPRRAQRRPTKQTSYDLTNHAKAYLEGGQYASGYDFLYSLLAAGTSVSTPAQPYIGFLAPPAYLAYASSMIADPKFTTKAQSTDAVKGADAALRYLQCVHTTIDAPAYPTIRKAFTFPEERNRRRAPGHRNAESLSPRLGGDVERIAGEAANQKSLWYCADDFWHIVGWAFNCSVAHKKRWSRWKLWVSTMLDFLESDWEVCVRRSQEDEDVREAILQESLVWHYIVGDESIPTQRLRRRRIVKAIHATATPESRKDYPEIWSRETLEPQRKKDHQPVGKVDFETGEIGDYDSDEEMQDVSEMDVDADDDTSSTTSEDGIKNLRDAVEQLGGQDSIELRQRMIALLAQVALALPSSFTPFFDLCDNILEDFNQLPTITYAVLISTSKMPDRLQIASNANLLHPLISGKPPNYFLYEPTQSDFETKLFPLRGTTQSFALNAKISLVLEQMFMYMVDQDALTPTDKLRKAIETGIEARRGVHGTSRGAKGNPEEETQAKGLMEACAARLLGLLEVLEMAAGMAPQPKGEAAAFLSFGTGSSLSPAPDSDTEGDD